jgi:hypothetical protein
MPAPGNGLSETPIDPISAGLEHFSANPAPISCLSAALAVDEFQRIGAARSLPHSSDLLICFDLDGPLDIGDEECWAMGRERNPVANALTVNRLVVVKAVAAEHSPE